MNRTFTTFSSLTIVLFSLTVSGCTFIASPDAELPATTENPSTTIFIEETTQLPVTTLMIETIPSKTPVVKPAIPSKETIPKETVSTENLTKDIDAFVNDITKDF